MSEDNSLVRVNCYPFYFEQILCLRAFIISAEGLEYIDLASTLGVAETLGQISLLCRHLPWDPWAFCGKEGKKRRGEGTQYPCVPLAQEAHYRVKPHLLESSLELPPKEARVKSEYALEGELQNIFKTTYLLPCGVYL